MGCFFVGKPWTMPNGAERAFCIACGKVYTAPTQYKKVRKFTTKMLLQYHKGAKVYCSARGDTAAFRALYSLEKGDVVLCVGELETKYYKNRKGEPIPKSMLWCDMVIPSDLIAILIEQSASPTIQRILKGDFPNDFGKGYKELYYENRFEREQRIQNAAQRAKEKEQD